MHSLRILLSIELSKMIQSQPFLCCFFFFNDTATTEIYTLSLHDALPISITFQNYFRMYHKLGGMTGTADTEAYEFQQIYGLETVIIPPNRPTIRKDMMDKIYLTAREKYQAVIDDVKDCYERGQPVLVGTTSIENSELLSHLLEKEKLPHQVLNAKQHAREAEIVAQAGRPKMVTIATNMAGRGTDIVLGGNVEKQVDHIRADASLAHRRPQRDHLRW